MIGSVGNPGNHQSRSSYFLHLAFLLLFLELPCFFELPFLPFFFELPFLHFLELPFFFELPFLHFLELPFFLELPPFFELPPRLLLLSQSPKLAHIELGTMRSSKRVILNRVVVRTVESDMFGSNVVC